MIPPIVTRLVTGACAVWVLLCLGAIAVQAVNNPMRVRERELEARLSGIETVTEELPQPDKAPLRQLRDKIVKKETLWRELVAAPAAPPKPVADPNLKEKLKGVTATRQTIARGDAVLVKFYLGPQDKAGAWKTVGEDINGLTIREITTEAVVFGIKQGEKEYTVELPRR